MSSGTPVKLEVQGYMLSDTTGKPLFTTGPLTVKEDKSRHKTLAFPPGLEGVQVEDEDLVAQPLDRKAFSAQAYLQTTSSEIQHTNIAQPYAQPLHQEQSEQQESKKPHCQFENGTVTFDLRTQKELVEWRVPVTKLTSDQKHVVSRVFRLQSHYDERFKLMLLPKVTADVKGCSSFKSSKGVGYIQLKCEADLEEPAVHWEFCLFVKDQSKQRPPVCHDFSKMAVMGLPKGQESWNLKEYVTDGYVVIGVEIRPASELKEDNASSIADASTACSLQPTQSEISSRNETSPSNDDSRITTDKQPNQICLYETIPEPDRGNQTMRKPERIPNMVGQHPFNCKPCAFVYKPEGCNPKDKVTGNPIPCTFCHECLPSELKNRKKMKAKKQNWQAEGQSNQAQLPFGGFYGMPPENYGGPWTGEYGMPPTLENYGGPWLVDPTMGGPFEYLTNSSNNIMKNSACPYYYSSIYY